MYKKTITYTDYNGNERTEDFYFNISRGEAQKLQMSKNGGLTEYLNRLIQTQDNEEIVKFFEYFIKLSYGVKSLDGRRFIKNDDVYNDFAQSEAYSVFFSELAESTDACAEFVNGALAGAQAVPKDHQEKQPPIHA